MKDFNQLREASRFLSETMSDCDDEGCDPPHTLIRATDVTDEIKELLKRYDTAASEGLRLAQELAYLKNRKWWDEIEVVTDRATGNVVVVRTHYRLVMEGLRVEATPYELNKMQW